jgi:hypothetical protein
MDAIAGIATREAVARGSGARSVTEEMSRKYRATSPLLAHAPRMAGPPGWGIWDVSCGAANGQTVGRRASFEI